MAWDNWIIYLHWTVWTELTEDSNWFGLDLLEILNWSVLLVRTGFIGDYLLELLTGLDWIYWSSYRFGLDFFGVEWFQEL